MKIVATDIDDYRPVMDALDGMKGAVNGKAPGDPVKCVNAIIDVIREEGQAAGKATPTMVPIGADAYLTVKRAAEKTLAVCAEWKTLSESVERDGPREGFFQQVEQYA